MATGRKGRLGKRMASENTTITVVKRPAKPVRASATLLQSTCHEGEFCMQTHKPGLCKGQKRGQTEPGTQDQQKQNPATVAKIAVQGLTNAITKAEQIATANQVRNPKLAAMARKAAADYAKALKPHQKTLNDAARENDKAKRVAVQDSRQQDAIDKRDQKKRDTLEKRAQAILDRRKRQAQDAAKLKSMTKKQRAAYLKGRAEARRRLRVKQENKLLKQAGKA